MNTKRLLSEKGLTLVEMMIAGAIFLVGLLGIIAFQGTILLGNDFSGNQTIARSLAFERLDNMMFTSFSNVTNCTTLGDFCYRDANGGSSTFPVATTDPNGGGLPHTLLDVTGHVNPEGRFRREWTIAPAPAPYSTVGRQITVRVFWDDIRIPGKATTAKSRELVISGIRVEP